MVPWRFLYGKTPIKVAALVHTHRENALLLEPALNPLRIAVKCMSTVSLPNSPPRATTAMVKANQRKLWLSTMPAVNVTYSLAFPARPNFGFGPAAGIAVTLH